jgi:WD40 repeat protein
VTIPPILDSIRSQVGPARMLDPKASRVEREWKAGSPLIGCRFDPSGRFLFATAEDGNVRRIDLLTGAVTVFAGHRAWVRGLAFVPLAPPDPGELTKAERSRIGMQVIAGAAAATTAIPRPRPFVVVSGDYHGKLVWWRGDADDPKPLRIIEAHDGWVRAVAASPDGKFVASCGNDGLVKVWSAADGSPVRTFAGHGCHVYNVAFHPAGGRLVSADLKGVLKDWDLAAGKYVRDLDAKPLYKYDTGFRADIGGARGLAFDPATGRLACCGITNVSNAFAGVGNPLVVAFDWADGKPRQLKPKDAFQGTAWGVAFHPAGYVVAAGGGSGGRVWFWKGDDATSSHTVTTPAGARDFALHPAGDRFAVAGANGTVYLYTVRPGAPPPVSPKKKK